MPPWGADPAYGTYANDVSLPQSQIDTIAAWVDGGAPKAIAPTCRRLRLLPTDGRSASPI